LRPRQPMTADARSLARLFERVSLAIVAAPTRWHARQWALFLAVAATTSLAYVAKWPLQASVQSVGGGAARAVALFIDSYGDGFAVTLAGFAVLFAGRLLHKPTFVEAALVLGAAGIWCWIFTKTGQLVLAERRPKDGGAMFFFALDGHGVSGHASAAGLVFAPVRDVLGRGATPRARRIATMALLAWAILVGWSRVWLGMHFVWNVLLGLAIGFFTGGIGGRRSQS